MTVGESIRSLRGAAGLMQRELAERVGISASMLSLVEAGKREPTIALLRSIGRALGIPTGVLFAIALDDPDIGQGTHDARRAHELTQSLFEAARHLVTGKRVRDDREDATPHPSRRSA